MNTYSIIFYSVAPYGVGTGIGTGTGAAVLPGAKPLKPPGVYKINAKRI